MLGQELNRTIVISEAIDEVVAKEVITLIMAINKFDAEMEATILGYQAEAIEIIINSGGGSASDGFAIIGAMEMSATPIVTYGVGMVASMALAIFLAGDVRISTRHTRYMYHSVSYGFGGHITDHEEQLIESNVINKMYDEVILDNTTLSEDELQEIRRVKKDYFMSALEAEELGLVDYVVDKPEKRAEILKELQEEGNEEESEVAIEIKSEASSPKLTQDDTFILEDKEFTSFFNK